MVSHAVSHRALKPISLGPVDDARTQVVAKYLDMARDLMDDVLLDAFPETANSLERWEALYNLDAIGSESVRRASVIAAKTAMGGLSLPFFMHLAESLGYTISIQRGSDMFRVGISLLGIDPLYSGNVDAHPVPPGWDQSAGDYCPDLWTCTITIISLGTNQDSVLLKRSFESLKPPSTTIKWN